MQPLPGRQRARPRQRGARRRCRGRPAAARGTARRARRRTRKRRPRRPDRRPRAARRRLRLDLPRRRRAGRRHVPGRASQTCRAGRRVELDERAATVRVPAGVELDLGATAKALACDRAATAAAAVAGCARSSRSAATSPSPASRPTAAGPFGSPTTTRRRSTRPGPTVALAGGGLATSSTTVRRWRSGATELHHLVDPRTGRPAESPWRTVSVAAKTCVDANVASTASFMLDDAPAWLEARRLPARLVSVGGASTLVARLAGGGRVSSHALWFATRGSGVVSLLLLTAIVVLGVAGATRWRSTRWPRFVVAGLHRNLTLLALVVHRAARAHDRARRLRADLDRQRDPSVHVAVPADLARSRRGRVRPPARADGHEPAARADRLRALARAALARVRVVADRARARARHRHRRARRVDAGRHRRLRRLRGRARCSGASRADRATPGLRTRGDDRRRSLLRSRSAAGISAGPAQHGWAARAGTPKSLLAPTTSSSSQAAAAPVVDAPDERVHGHVHRSRSRVVAGRERTRARQHLRQDDRRATPACSGSGFRASRSTAAASP